MINNKKIEKMPEWVDGLASYIWFCATGILIAVVVSGTINYWNADVIRKEIRELRQELTAKALLPATPEKE